MATRNPASVLPDPVGAAIRVSRPAAINGQPRAWGSVGPSGKRRRNQAATAGWSVARTGYGPAGPPGGGASGNCTDDGAARTMMLMVGTGCDNQVRIGPGPTVGRAVGRVLGRRGRVWAGGVGSGPAGSGLGRRRRSRCSPGPGLAARAAPADRGGGRPWRARGWAGGPGGTGGRRSGRPRLSGSRASTFGKSPHFWWSMYITCTFPVKSRRCRPKVAAARHPPVGRSAGTVRGPAGERASATAPQR